MNEKSYVERMSQAGILHDASDHPIPSTAYLKYSFSGKLP